MGSNLKWVLPSSDKSELGNDTKHNELKSENQFSSRDTPYAIRDTIY